MNPDFLKAEYSQRRRNKSGISRKTGLAIFVTIELLIFVTLMFLIYSK